MKPLEKPKTTIRFGSPFFKLPGHPWTHLYFWVLLATLTHRGQTANSHFQKEIRCSNIDARNHVTALEKLRNCTVVEGSLRIVLMESMTEKDFEPYSFPHLREVTHYIMMYRVNGVRSLGKLFPNLEKIGGAEDFRSFSLILYQLYSLQEVTLYNLREISSGSVVFIKNTNLCFAKTVQWGRITKWDASLNKLNIQEETKKDTNVNKLSIQEETKNDTNLKKPGPQTKNCSTCPKACPNACWNTTHCQQDWKASNCDPMCLGGCYPDDPKSCFTCKGLFNLEGECVKTCPNNTYVFDNRRCVTRESCTSIRVRTLLGKAVSPEKFYVVQEERCIKECPCGIPNSLGVCPGIVVDGVCIKECAGRVVGNSSDALILKGCTHINTSLHITIRISNSFPSTEDPKTDLHNLLEEGLGAIQQIDGYLMVSRSSVMDLNFLRNLSKIQGKDKQRNQSIVVTHNENLQELWDWSSKSLIINKGKIIIHSNPNLCLNKIETLVKEIGYKDKVNLLYIDSLSNGNAFQCNSVRNIVTLKKVTSNAVRLHVFNQNTPISQNTTEATSTVLRYVVYYNKYNDEDKYNTFTRCSDDGWRTTDVSVDPNNSQNVDIELTDLEPATTYLFYVSTYMSNNNYGWRSETHNVTTLPAKPSGVVGLSVLELSNSTIHLTWQPPRRPNGKLEEYVITWFELSEDGDYIKQRNYCETPMLPEKPPDKTPSIPDNQENDNKTCCAGPRVPVQDPLQDEFEDLCSFSKHSLTGIFKKNEHLSCKSYIYSHIYGNSETPTTLKLRTNILESYSEHLNPKKNWATQNEIQSDDDKTKTKYKEQGKVGHQRNVKRVPFTTTKWIIHGLKHFQTYVIYLKACREKHENETGNNGSEEYRCSISEMITARTEGGILFDLIPKIANTNNILRWEVPTNPNGIILAFELEYFSSGLDRFKGMVKKECLTYAQYINDNKQHALDDFNPGKYGVSVRVVSLFGKGPYSEIISFDIVEEVYTESPPVILYVAAFGLVLLLTMIGGVVYLNRIKGGEMFADVNPNYHYIPDDYEINKEDIKFIRELGVGSFGKVYEGFWKSRNLPCAIKTINQDVTAENENEFLMEASVMMTMTNSHFIVEIYGVSSRQSPPFVLMELMELGDLKNYLRENREKSPITPAMMFKMALEIADGMAFMEAKKFVHRDLSARNCMVNSELTVKVGDFGMARDIYEMDYYRKINKGFLPIRWMAPESLKDGVFTSQSDIWSYGVVLWEIVTMAEQPYQGLSNEEVVTKVMAGMKMDIPKTTPPPLKALMELCWKTNPSSRSSFMNIIGTLDYYHDEEFRRVSFYHSAEAISTRAAPEGYVEMKPLLDPLPALY